VVHPLPWSRIYVLAVPPGQRGFDPLIPADSAAFRADLARDAVRVEARAAAGPFWWSDPGRCSEIRERATPSTTGSRVTTALSSDPVGRAIAERLVALSGQPMRVIDGEYARTPVTAIRSDLGTAYVIPVPHTTLVPCREIAAWPAGATVVPLIEDGAINAVIDISVDATERVRVVLNDPLAALPDSPTWHAWSAAEHERLVVAIEARDAAGARAAAADHVVRTDDAVHALLRTIGA